MRYLILLLLCSCVHVNQPAPRCCCEAERSNSFDGQVFE